jgi:hypothetical protein
MTLCMQLPDTEHNPIAALAELTDRLSTWQYDTVVVSYCMEQFAWCSHDAAWMEHLEAIMMIRRCYQLRVCCASCGLERRMS